MDDKTRALPVPKKRVPEKVKRAIQALITRQAKTVTDAAKLVGWSRQHLSSKLGESHVRAYWLEQRERALLVAAGRGAVRLGELVDAKSEKVALDASTRALAIQGHRPPASPHVAVNIGIQAGYVIDLSEPDGSEMRIVGGGKPAAPAPE